MVDDPLQGRLGLAPMLRRAWIGYRRRLDEELAKAGFTDHVFPDGRVMRIVLRSPGTTIAGIGREIGITRQGASKIVGGLAARGYVTTGDSPTDRREKTVALTSLAHEFLDAQRRAARRVETALVREVGPDSIEALQRLLDALGAEEQPRLLLYLQDRNRRQKSASGADHGSGT